MRLSEYFSIVMHVLVVISLSSTCNAIEAQWTSATDSGSDGQQNGGDGGPLPLSQNQRDQLLHLEEAIVSSPNPQETLIKIAEGNNMSPRELVDLLERNRADMEAAGVVPPRPGSGGGGKSVSNTLPRQLLGAFLSIFTSLGILAKSHPQTFSVMFTAVLISLYATIQAPRTGIVMSTGPNALLLSGGHSTFFVPPAEYVTRYINMESTKLFRAYPRE